MPNLKEVRTRIASTQSTQQITKAMKLVSATKLRKGQQAITKMRPYANKLNSILVNLADSAQSSDSLQKYFASSEVKKALVLSVSSDRGLCGGFNSNIIKTTKQLVLEKYQADGVEVDVWFIGKKAYDVLKSTDINADTRYMELFKELSAETAFETAESVIQAFLNGEYDEVRMIYNEFKNAATQFVRAEKLLPVEMEKFDESSSLSADYIFEPSKEGILTELVPRAIKTRFYKNLLDSVASEHGARMVAMDKATENASELLDKLKLDYNKARQAAITNEILEIVGGAAALEA
jgi:F-type H+-transporting ATPase subunit gamma